MQYTKAIIDLILEARRRAPSDLKSDIKFTNPNILQELEKDYQCSEDPVFRALIKEIFNLTEQPLAEKSQQHPLEQAAAQNTEETTKRQKRIYRGQLVA